MLFRSPSSSLWQEKIVGCQNKQVKCGIVLLIVTQCLVFGWIGQVIIPDVSLNKAISGDWSAYGQYTELADAIIEGHLYLDRTPAPSLAEMENPYDIDARNQYVVAENGEKWNWDYAY